jgi:hypothetical protein
MTQVCTMQTLCDRLFGRCIFYIKMQLVDLLVMLKLLFRGCVLLCQNCYLVDLLEIPKLLVTICCISKLLYRRCAGWTKVIIRLTHCDVKATM